MAPPIKRRLKASNSEPEEEEYFETLDLGNAVYMFEGKRFGPGSVDVTDERIANGLRAAVERVSTREEARLQGIRNSGIQRPESAPIHMPVANDVP